MPIAADSILCGQLGEIKAGEEIPASYPGTMGDEVKTDFERLEALGLIADEKAEKPVEKSAPTVPGEPAQDEVQPEPETGHGGDEDTLPDGVEDLGSGWYQVGDQKIRGRDAAIKAAATG